MTPDEFLAALRQIGWTKRQLTVQLACDTNIATRWSRGDTAIPPVIGRWLTRLAAHHEGHPAPQNWRTR